MKTSVFRRLFAINFICWFYLTPALAETAGPDVADVTWQNWLKNQIETHPDVVAAQQQLKAELFLADGRRQPLYNPALETEFEHLENENNYRLGITQTLDVWGKRTNRRQQAEFLRLAAEQNYAQTYQDKLTEALSELVTYQASKARYRLASEQEQQIDTLFQLIQDRQKAGDLGQIDVNLSQASLMQKLNETAQAMAEFQAAETRVRELFPGLPSGKAAIPAQLWQVNPGQEPDAVLTENHPRVLFAKAQWEIQKEASELARLDTKAEPTVGINAGRDGDEEVVGLTFSIPLNVRNSFSAERKAAAESALSAEANYLAVRRKQQFQAQAAGRIVQQYQIQLKRWKALLSQNSDDSRKLLTQQWRSGDIGTNEYLLALQQNTAGALSGIALQEKFQLAVIAWLKSTGQLKTHMLHSTQNQI